VRALHQAARAALENTAKTAGIARADARVVIGRRAALVLGVALATACGDADPSSLDPSPPFSAQPPVDVRAPRSLAAPRPFGANPYDDASALAWLDRQCRACHGPKANGTRDMTWPMPATLTREWLEVTDATATVYELLRRKRDGTGAGRLPSPTPPNDVDAHELDDVVQWFERRLPFSAFDADVRFGRKPAGPPRPELRFTCEPASARVFLARLTNAALGRQPTASEIVELAPDLDAKVTQDERVRMADKLEGAWKLEFMQTGLARLATSIATAGAIPFPGSTQANGTHEPLAPAIKADVDDELRRLVLAHYDAWDYTDYFTADVVMTSPNTAPLYAARSRADGASVRSSLRARASSRRSGT
jgi:hypothetical protein